MFLFRNETVFKLQNYLYLQNIACQDIPRIKYLNVSDAFENKDKQTTSNKTKPFMGKRLKHFLFRFKWPSKKSMKHNLFMFLFFSNEQYLAFRFKRHP